MTYRHNTPTHYLRTDIQNVSLFLLAAFILLALTVLLYPVSASVGTGKLVNHAAGVIAPCAANQSAGSIFVIDRPGFENPRRSVNPSLHPFGE